MKTQLSSIDVRILSKEFENILNSRIDKIYQVSKRELKIRLHLSGKGTLDLVIAPNFLCISRYDRPAPKDASSFAMQLRKHLSGGFLRDVRQHSFDRILEFSIENKDIDYLLIVELFSKGNVILLDSDRKIIGLLEWQKWRHRRLGVRQMYEYPPAGVDTPVLDAGEFNKILSGSEKGIAATLATELSLGGLYAEELCLGSGIDKGKISSELSEKEAKSLFRSLQKLLDREMEPRIVLEDNTPVDVIPFGLQIYKKFKQKNLESFNDAVDEYFSKQEFGEKEDRAESRFQDKVNRLREIKEGQRESLKELEKKAEDCRKAGDLIYQNLQDVEAVIKLAKGKELSAGNKTGRIRIESINKDGTVVVEVEQ